MKIIVLSIIATLQFTGCAAYNSHVASRSVGVRGYGNAQTENVGGKVVYTVDYR